MCTSPRVKPVLGQILQRGVAASLPPVILAEGASIVASIIPLNLELGAQVVVVL